MVHSSRLGWEGGGAPEAHLVSAEGLGVAQLAELSLGAQQFGLYFWIHVCQKIPHIVHGGHGELRDGQLQRAGKGDHTFLKDDICSQGAHAGDEAQRHSGAKWRSGCV